MKFIVQRVSEANVCVDNQIIGEIKKGFLVLVGVSNTDTKEIADKMVSKLIHLCIFEDSDGTFTVVDYKTNQTVVPEIYYAQLKCYKDAVCQIFGKSKNEVKCVLYYLRYAKAVDITEECDKINLKEF